jgi:putative Holliday junction resolvase
VTDRETNRALGATPAGALLGIDLGERRIGIAVADAGDLAARPLVTIARGRDLGADAAGLATLVRAHGATALVVGLPLEASGAEGPMAAAARTWAAAIGERLGLPVSMRDERLSSHVAESRLGPMPKGRSGGPPSKIQRERYRARVDREAASIILQDELEARRA